MSLKTTEFEIEGPFLIHGLRHHDNRGYFSETYQENKFKSLGLPHFVQDNLSLSAKGVFRGLHWQEYPHAQGKLVTCLAGEIIDYIVDIREGSKTFMQHLAINLSSTSLDSLWVPEGFAHGFLALSDDTLVNYKVTDYWHADSENSLNCEILNLKLPVQIESLILSEKDALASKLLTKSFYSKA